MEEEERKIQQEREERLAREKREEEEKRAKKEKEKQQKEEKQKRKAEEKKAKEKEEKERKESKRRSREEEEERRKRRSKKSSSSGEEEEEDEVIVEKLRWKREDASAAKGKVGKNAGTLDDYPLPSDEENAARGTRGKPGVRGFVVTVSSFCSVSLRFVVLLLFCGCCFSLSYLGWLSLVLWWIFCNCCGVFLSLFLWSFV